MMATLRCDHSDVVAFIDAKRRADRLRHFNSSVQVTDTFIQAIERDERSYRLLPRPILRSRSDSIWQTRHTRCSASADDRSFQAMILSRIALSMWDHLTEREGGWLERLVESCAICREPFAASRLAAQKGFCIDLDQPLPGSKRERCHVVRA
jgi:hypothetical protein